MSAKRPSHSQEDPARTLARSARRQLKLRIRTSPGGDHGVRAHGQGEVRGCPEGVIGIQPVQHSLRGLALAQGLTRPLVKRQPVGGPRFLQGQQVRRLAALEDLGAGGQRPDHLDRQVVPLGPARVPRGQPPPDWPVQELEGSFQLREQFDEGPVTPGGPCRSLGGRRLNLQLAKVAKGEKENLNRE